MRRWLLTLFECILHDSCIFQISIVDGTNFVYDSCIFQVSIVDLTPIFLSIAMAMAQTLSMVATLRAEGSVLKAQVSLSSSLSPSRRSRRRSRSRCKPSRSCFVEQPHDGNGNDNSWKNDDSWPHDGSWKNDWWAGDRSAQ